MDQSLFVRQGETYVPTASAGGPWSPSHLHGGSPTGLLALLMEQATADSGLRLSRLTVDLLRPVPAAPLTAELAVVRAGRRLRVLQASLLADGVEVCRASGLFLEQAGARVPDFGRFETGGLEPRGDRPVMTLAPSTAACSATRSTSGAATSGAAASPNEGRRPFRTSPKSVNWDTTPSV